MHMLILLFQTQWNVTLVFETQRNAVFWNAFETCLKLFETRLNLFETLFWNAFGKKWSKHPFHVDGHMLLIKRKIHVMYNSTSAGNNSRSSDIVRPNFENVRPISHYDWTRWPNISPAHLEFSSSRCCQSIDYVRCKLSNVRPKGRFERTYVLWIKKNYFQHCNIVHV